MNGVNYFSMHRQILDQQHQLEASVGASQPSTKMNTERAEKLAEIKNGAQAFESYFIQTLLKEMRKTIPKGEDGGVGLGEDMYQSMFDEEIALKITQSGGMGLAKLLSKKLSEALKFSAESTDIDQSPQVFKSINR